VSFEALSPAPRKRKRPAAQATPTTRLVSGNVGPVQLGRSRLLFLDAGFPHVGSARLATAVSVCGCWLRVRTDSGGEMNLRLHHVADHLLFSGVDFYDPALWYYDWSGINPLRLPGWTAGMVAHLRAHNTDLPAAWLETGDAPFPYEHTTGGLEAERAHLRRRLVEIASEARAASTIQGYRHPALKFLWWMATRQRSLPPSSEDVAEYLVFLSDLVDTVGAVSTAQSAISYLCVVNGWSAAGILCGRATLPLNALRRRHRHVLRKSPGLTLECTTAIVRSYCRVLPGVPPNSQWRFAVGAGIGAAFKLLARYNDISKCRYDTGFFEITPWFVRILVVSRKNEQYECTWLEIARPLDPNVFGVYHALCIGHALFEGRGFILPRVLANGTVDTSQPMPYKDYVLHLRQAARHAGCPEVDAEHVAGQSPRSGAATQGAEVLRPHELCRLAGVKGLNWILGYNRHRTADRLRASWALGL